MNLYIISVMRVLYLLFLYFSKIFFASQFLDKINIKPMKGIKIFFQGQKRFLNPTMKQ